MATAQALLVAHALLAHALGAAHALAADHALVAVEAHALRAVVCVFGGEDANGGLCLLAEGILTR